jgi:hypothetical protein
LLVSLTLITFVLFSVFPFICDKMAGLNPQMYVLFFSCRQAPLACARMALKKQRRLFACDTALATCSTISYRCCAEEIANSRGI